MRRNAHELLQALADADGLKSIYELRQHLGITKDNAHRAIGVLMRRGLASRPRYGSYRITDAGRDFLRAGRTVTNGRNERSPRSVRTDTFRARAWRAMRMQRRFTLNDLVELAGHPSQRNPRNSAERYVSALARAGYLVRMATSEPHPAQPTNPKAAPARWLLLKNTGPLPPGLNKAETALYDPNTGEEVPCGKPS